MKNYYRILMLSAATLSLLLIGILTGCRTPAAYDFSYDTTDVTVIGADGRAYVGGCVETKVIDNGVIVERRP